MYTMILLAAIGQFQILAPDNRVTAVIDGDTIEIDGRRVELVGIDAPDKGQQYHEQSTAWLRDRLLGEVVREDSGRIIHDNACVNCTLVRHGLAWWLPADGACERMPKYEIEARRKKRGLFKNCDAIEPWNYRKRGSVSLSGAKGNAASGARRPAAAPRGAL